MPVSGNLSSERNVVVRFDVVGWTGDDADAKESTLDKIRTYMSSAVKAGLSTLDVAEDLLDYDGLFEKVEVSREDAGANIIVNVLAVAAGHGDQLRDVREFVPGIKRAS